MKNFLRTLVACLLVASGAAGQTPPDACRSVADERPVQDALLAYFQVMEGTVEVRSLDRRLAADTYAPTVAPAVADFNTRNAGPCPAIDGPVAGLQLFPGTLKTRLSRVGFDATATTAFAEITMIGDPETGSSHFVVLKKDRQTWTVVEEYAYRIF